MKTFSFATAIALVAFLFSATFASAQDEVKKEEVKEDVLKIALGINPANPMMYDKARIEVPAGKEIELSFENTGALPKMAAGHNVVILKKGVEMVAFASATGALTMQAAQGTVKEYLNDEQKKQVIAFTKVLGPKEKDVITFTAPEEAGDYDFVCTFPGHFAMMKGKLVVK